MEKLSSWKLRVLKSRHSLYSSIEISTFSHFSFEISTFSLLFFWNLDILFTLLLKSLRSLYFSIELSTFSLLVYWNLCCPLTFLVKSLRSLYFSIEISTFSLLFYWKPTFYLFFYGDLYPHVPLDHIHYIAKSNHALLLPMQLHTTCVPTPHLHQHYIAKSDHALLPPM